jgi:hypothetical protein
MRMSTGPAGSIVRSPQIRSLHVDGGANQISLRQLATLAEQVEIVTHFAERLVEGRSKAELNLRLEPNSWSVAQCLDHLAQTTRAFLPAITDSVATAPKLLTSRPLRTGLLARLFIRNLEPPYRIRIKVLPQLTPQHQDFDLAWSSFVDSQSQLSEAVFSAAGLAIDTVKIKSPVYARVSYNVYGAFRMLMAHERRHLWQIEQILGALDRRRALKTDI